MGVRSLIVNICLEQTKIFTEDKIFLIGRCVHSFFNPLIIKVSLDRELNDLSFQS